MILLDTNILLRFKNPNAPQYPQISQKIFDLIRLGADLIICPQTIYEFYVVATRPLQQNGFGLEVSEAFAEIDNITTLFKLMPDNSTIYMHWKTLVAKYAIKGKKSHDARLVAFMQSHQIQKLYTLNMEDFKRFEAIIEFI